MEVLALIPARGGSKGIPPKNIKWLAGEPLIAYAIREARKSQFITRLLVSTEDEEIAKNRAKEWSVSVAKNPFPPSCVNCSTIFHVIWPVKSHR
jgi:CMP-N,N'-diacetyllegionaminic acid synthase